MAASQKELFSVRLCSLVCCMVKGSRGQGRRLVHQSRPPRPLMMRRRGYPWTKHSPFKNVTLISEKINFEHWPNYETSIFQKTFQTDWHLGFWNCGILTGLDWTRGTGEQTLTSLHVVISTCGPTVTLSVSTSPLRVLGDQTELERISKLEYLMRTKEHRTTWTARVEATQLQGGGWVDFIFFFTHFVQI